MTDISLYDLTPCIQTALCCNGRRQYTGRSILILVGHDVRFICICHIFLLCKNYASPCVHPIQENAGTSDLQLKLITSVMPLGLQPHRLHTASLFFSVKFPPISGQWLDGRIGRIIPMFAKSTISQTKIAGIKFSFAHFKHSPLIWLTVSSRQPSNRNDMRHFALITCRSIAFHTFFITMHKYHRPP